MLCVDDAAAVAAAAAAADISADTVQLILPLLGILTQQPLQVHLHPHS